MRARASRLATAAALAFAVLAAALAPATAAGPREDAAAQADAGQGPSQEDLPVLEYQGVINSRGATETAPVTVVVDDAEPGRARLSHDNWDGDGAFTVAAGLKRGTNATSYRTLENGVVVAEGPLRAATPGAQRATATVTGRAPGTYTYVAELINPAGTTVSAPLKVTVRR